MRDLVVREGLETMARDAAKRFRELIATGEEIPYEVREPGNGSPLCQYEPLTERFVRDRAGALRELDSFGTTCAALEASQLPAPYLEQFAVAVPPEARARAELAAIVFLCRLWTGSTDFSLDSDRLEAAIDELEIGGEAADDEIEVVVPLRGLQMPVARLDLATATLVRADTVEVPAEARASDVMGASPWEPTFLAIARTTADDAADDGDGVAVRGADAFRRLITTLRLFRPGGIGLGPYAWVASGANRWRRISTGAGKPRPGGYRLGEAELGELVALSRALASRDTPFGRLDSGRPGLPVALGRAVSRFEAGLERTLVIEALNDNLLALRFVLEGGGPADLGMPMRIAALCAEPDQRADVKAVVERALALERELWSGEPHAAGPVPAETATRLEELTRAILKDAACGHLGTDLRSTADEILLADGLAVGDGAGEQRGATEEWDLSDELEEISDELEGIDGMGADESHDGDEIAEPRAEEVSAEPRNDEGAAEPRDEGPEPWLDEVETELAPEPTELAPEPTGFEPRIEVVKVSGPRSRSRDDASEPEEEQQMTLSAHVVEDERRDDVPTTTIEADVEPSPEPDLERIPSGSPVLRLIEQTRSERRERADRLANLFPRAETEWNVREIGYDRRRRAKVSA